MPRCGTHTLLRVLSQRYQGRQIVAEWRAGVRDIHANVVPSEYEDYFRWTCCRNPYTRVASAFWYLRNRRKSMPKHRDWPCLWDFEAFCHCIVDRLNQPRRGPLWPMWQQLGDQRIDRIIRVEHFLDDYMTLPFWRGEMTLPRLGKSKPKKPLKGILTPQCVDLIQQWAGPDFGRFGYSKTPPI